MAAMSQPIAAHYRFTDFIMEKVLSDIDDAQARTRTRDGQGPSIAWVVGHVLCFRHRILGMLGVAREDAWAATCGTAGATDGADYPRLAEIRVEWQATQQALEEALAGLTDEQLLGPTTAPGAPHGERTMLDDITFAMWHESYHMGALGAIRTSLGLRPTSQLVMGG